jgi:hypothetical protein
LVGGVLVVILCIVVFSFVFRVVRAKLTTRTEKKEHINNTQNKTIVDLVHTDTDGDGVFDWEEALWGLNKYKPATFDDVPDLKYIENKRKELNLVDSKDDKTLTETDKFAREFFSTYAAIQGSEDINDQTMKNIAAALGQKIVNPQFVDKYAADDVKFVRVDNEKTKEAYYVTISDLFAKYEAQGIGDELPIINSGLNTYDKKGEQNSFENITRIAQAYKDFASNVIDTPVPESLATYHLRIANAANNTGVSVENMAQVITDPLVGVSGVSEYDKYSNELIKAVADLEASFTE